MIAALTVSPARQHVRLYFMADADHYRTNVEVADFLRMALRHLRGKVIVVWDRGSNHKGEPIRDLLRRYPRRSVEWLPAYAPELNPVEQVWQRAKYADLANFVPDHVEHLRREVEGSLVKTRAEQAILRSSFEYAKLKL